MGESGQSKNKRVCRKNNRKWDERRTSKKEHNEVIYGILFIGLRYVKILVTGSSGLIGSEAVAYFDREGHEVIGVDNNMRREFFGPPGDTLWNLEQLKKTTRHFRPSNLDIRDRQKILDLFKLERFDTIIHCAAQPSHDKA